MTDLWDSRASLGTCAGTRDRIAKELEMRELSRHVKDGMRVLDVGCGDGETLIRLAIEHNIDAWGMDASDGMLGNAGKADVSGCGKPPVFFSGDVTTSDLTYLGASFDVAYTERCIVNLSDWPTQLGAIQAILSLVKPTGKLLLCECSIDGLRAINHLRASVGLPGYAAPGHNRYLINAEMQDARRRGDLPPFFVKDISSTYYFLSRIVNAKVAQEEGREPDYDSPINRLALSLPAETVWGMGQVRLWVFQKE